MKTVEHHYTKLKEILYFKDDLNSKRIAFIAANTKQKPSYAQQSYFLMNKASMIISELRDYINDNSTIMSDLEIETIDKLYNACHNVSKPYREDAFKLLSDTVNDRLKHFSY